MNIKITDVDEYLITEFGFSDAIAKAFRVTNLEAVAKVLKIFVMCADDQASLGAQDRNGREVVSEGWIAARLLGDTSWTTLGEPVFGDDWNGITGDILELALPSSGYVDVEVIMNIPAYPSSSGTINWDIKVMAKDA